MRDLTGIEEQTRVLVFLCKVSADASDQPGDELDESAELSGEEGVTVLWL